MKQPTINEVWKSIPGYEGVYEASNLGRVRSLDRYVNIGNDARKLLRGQLIQPSPHSRGYHYHILYGKGKPKNRLAHRLVKEAFDGPCPPGMVVRHLNDDKIDNRLENLAWGTQSDNMRDSVRNGTHAWSSRDKCLRGHLLAEPNLVRAAALRGKRNCLACHRALSYIRSHSEFGQYKQLISDIRYRDLMYHNN